MAGRNIKVLTSLSPTQERLLQTEENLSKPERRKIENKGGSSFFSGGTVREISEFFSDVLFYWSITNTTRRTFFFPRNKGSSPSYVLVFVC